eukprot:Colp12_sorted_trinity150504_noHs@15224
MSPPTALQAAAQMFVRFLGFVFFEKIEVRGLENIPKDGPVVFAGNHPNGLMDAMMIMTQCGRYVSPVAKDILFESPLLGIILRMLRAVPIRSRKDKGDSEDHHDANEEAFRDILGLLQDGGSIALFPEGTTYTSAALQPLRYGIAKLVFAATAESNIPVKVVPCGLTYLNKEKFRSKCFVDFGTPITIDSVRMAEYRQDRRSAYTTFMKELDRHLRYLTINVPDGSMDSLRLAYLISDLFADEEDSSTAEKVVRTRQATESCLRVIQHAEGEGKIQDLRRIDSLLTQIEQYQRTLDILRLRDADVRGTRKHARLVVDLIKHVALHGLIVAPLSLPGFCINLPLLWLIRTAGYKFATGCSEVVSTYKLTVGVTLVPLQYMIFWFISLDFLSVKDATLLVWLLFFSFVLGALYVKPLIDSLPRKVVALMRATLFDIRALRETRSSLREQLYQLYTKYEEPPPSPIPIPLALKAHQD